MSKLLSSLRSLPTQLVLSILCAISLAHSLDHEWICRFYTLSTLFIDILMITLPLIVFVYIVSAIVSMERGSPLLILSIFAGVIISNGVALLCAYGLGKMIIPQFTLPSVQIFSEQIKSSIKPLFCLQAPFEIQTDIAMYTGIGLGIMTTLLPTTLSLKSSIKRYSFMARDVITLFLQKIFIPLLPLYVFGFALKLSYEDSLNFLITSYTQVFLVSLIVVIVYIGLYYVVAAQGSCRQSLMYIRTMLPAGLTGFSTMSSAATLPVTLECTRTNLNDWHFPELVIPATSNIHMVGDDLNIVFMAFTILLMNGQPIPEFNHFIPFICAFCLAKFSCVGVPGASVFVILPVLQTYLGFTPEMTVVLTTLYVLQDPFGTCANVMGNGAFAIMFYKTVSKLKTLLLNCPK